MPPWLIAVLSVWLLVLPLGALAWSVWKLRGEIAATEDEPVLSDDCPTYDPWLMQQANPRGVGRHDWPL